MRCMLMLAALSSLFACQSPPASAPSTPAAAEGRGVIAVEPGPAGGTTWPCPQWTVGKRMVVVRGERQRAQLVVVERRDDRYVLDAGRDMRMHRGLDLANLGDHMTDGQTLRVLSPGDVRYHWPLAVGKRWTCEYVERTLGSPPMTVQASYEVEALDTVTVPAGTFEALRIARRVRRIDAPDYLTNTQFIWYAPSIGCEVRQTVGDPLLELVEHDAGTGELPQ